nr:hypothetical protein CTI12_AA408640 [Tanacetum cinerariifolium]
AAKTVSYHKLYDILKQHQHEVNEIRAEKIARVTNPLAFVAQQQLVNHPQHHPTQLTQNSSTRSQQAAIRNRGKAIVNSPQPIYDQEPSMVAEDEETHKKDVVFSMRNDHEVLIIDIKVHAFMGSFMCYLDKRGPTVKSGLKDTDTWK